MDYIIFGSLIGTFLGSMIVHLKLSTIIREWVVDQYSSMADVSASQLSGVSLSIVVPVYNEEKRIIKCAESILSALQGYDGRCELIFVDDVSADSSVTLIQNFVPSIQYKERIIFASSGRNTNECLGRWVGKSLPCHVGYSISQGRYLLFIDADVRLEPGSIRHLLAQVLVNRTEFLSVIPKIECRNLHCWAFYPLSIICQMLAFDFIRRHPEDSYPSASGQIMLFERNAYETMGGFEALSDNVCQDVRAAKKAKSCGLRQKHILGFNLAYMNTDLRFFDMVKSFSKSILVAVEHDIPKVLAMPFLMIFVTWLPYFILVTELYSATTASVHDGIPVNFGIANVVLSINTILAHFISLRELQVMVKGRSMLVALYPIGALMFLLISCHSVITYYWRNKKYWKWKDRRILPEG